MIKINNNTPTDITWTQNNQVYVVAAMQKDGTYVYGRAGTYKTGTLPTGVASLTCTKTAATCEPTSQTGTVANNAAIYHGDRLYWTATASPYYTVSVPYYNSSSSTYFTDFKSTRTATGVSLCGVTAERATRSVTATINDHVSSIAVSFTKKSDGGSGSTIVTSSGAIANVWQGGAITYTPSASLYWTASAGTIAAGSGAASIAPTASRTPRSVNVNINENISSVKVTYTETGTGQSISVTKTSSGSVANVWQGDTVTYTVTPATYWTSSGGSYNAGTSAITISPTASRAQRTTIVGINTNISSVTVNYKKTSDGSSGSITTTSSGPITGVWQGADITYTATADTYWTASDGTISAGTGTATIAPVATRAARNVTVVCSSSDHVSSVTTSYTNLGGVSASQTQTSTYGIDDAWQGAGISYTAVADTYWTVSGGSYNAGTSAIQIRPQATRAERSVTVGINTNVSSVAVSYNRTSDGNSWSTTRTSSGSISGVWQGAQINYTGVGATYWYVPSGTIQAGTSAVSIAPTAARSPRAISVTKPAGAAMSVTGISPSTGSSQTVAVPTATRYTNNTTVLQGKFWQGNQITWSATAPSGMVILPISGTISAGTSTAVIKTEVVKQKTTIISTSQSVVWAITQPSATKTMIYSSMSAGATSTIEDRDSIYLNGTWYPARPGPTGTTVAILDKEVPASATASSPAVVATYGSKTLYAYMSGDRLSFYVGGANSSMYLTISSIGANVYYLGQPLPPDIDDNEAPEGLYIYNPNPYPVKLYINGTYMNSDQSHEEYRNEYYDTLDAYGEIHWSPSTFEEFFLSASLDFYFAGGGTQASDATHYSY